MAQDNIPWRRGASVVSEQNNKSYLKSPASRLRDEILPLYSMLTFKYPVGSDLSCAAQ